MKCLAEFVLLACAAVAFGCYQDGADWGDGAQTVTPTLDREAMDGAGTKAEPVIYPATTEVNAVFNAIVANDLAALTTAASAVSDLNFKDDDGRTPLHVAVLASRRRNNLELIEYLLSHGADTRVLDKEGNTALRYAVCSLGIAEAFMKHGADPNRIDKSSATALHHVATRHSPGIETERKLAELYLAHGALVSATDSKGNMALHVAALYGNLRVAEVLIRHGAAVNDVNLAGQTALDLAQSGSDELWRHAGVQTRELLIRAGGLNGRQ